MGWAAESSHGGSAVIDYEVWFNQGSIINLYILYATVNSATFEKIISTVSSGEAYSVKVRARNRVGYGAYSSIGTIYAATVPDAPNAPTRVVDSNT